MVDRCCEIACAMAKWFAKVAAVGALGLLLIYGGLLVWMAIMIGGGDG